jgi:hypothetical protein
MFPLVLYDFLKHQRYRQWQYFVWASRKSLMVRQMKQTPHTDVAIAAADSEFCHHEAVFIVVNCRTYTTQLVMKWRAISQNRSIQCNYRITEVVSAVIDKFPSNKTNKLHGMSSWANYTDRATAACRRSDCQLVRIEGATWSAWRIPTAVSLGFLDRSRYFSIE